MIRFALTFALIATLALPARAEPEAIQNTISSQIDAFLADDFERAFTYAAPSIQGLFGSAERFEMMVRNGYPMVHRPADLQFLDLREIAGRLWQRVQVQDQNGTFHYLDYAMVQTENGWQIAGVQLLPAPDVSA